MYLINYFVTCVVVVLTVIQGSYGCSEVLITHTKYRHHATGLFKETATECNNKTVFQQAGGDHYINYIDDADFTGWMVSNQFCQNYGSLVAQDNASHPTEVTATWQEFSGDIDALWNDDSWDTNTNLRVTCYTRFEGCEKIVIFDTSHQDDIEGRYIWQGDNTFCDGKFVYKRSSSYYLYTYGGIWVVGPTRCGDDAHIQAYDDALYPEDVTTTWQEVYGTWRETNLKLKCDTGAVSGGTRLSSTAIIGVVLGGAALLSMI